MSLLDLFPGKLWIYTAVLGAAFVAGGTTAWKVQNWRMASQENERAQQQLVQERELHTLNLKRESGVVAAQNAAAARATMLRRDADSARAGADRLRDSSERALSFAKASHDACLKSAAAFSVVFGECRARRDALAEVAGRHANDVQTLMDGWPK